jgi:hypothetical protein
MALGPAPFGLADTHIDAAWIDGYIGRSRKLLRDGKDVEAQAPSSRSKRASGAVAY